MANRLDYRNHPEAQELLKQLPEMKYTPLVGATDLREITRVFAGIGALDYPINSAGELMEKLGGGEKTVSIAEVAVDPVLMIKRMPAYYFPIASAENFVEKMAELLRANRKQVDVPTELQSIKRQLPELSFPIENREQLLKSIGRVPNLRFQGRGINTRQILSRVNPQDLFPIQSQDDFDRKMALLMANREIVVKD